MALEGAQKGFTDVEKSKFQPIADALKANDNQKAKGLVAQLNANEKTRFKQFFAEDKQKFNEQRVAKRQGLEAQASAGEKNVTRITTEIADLKAQKAAVFSQGAKAAVGQIKADFRGAPSPAPAPQGQGKVVNGLKY